MLVVARSWFPLVVAGVAAGLLNQSLLTATVAPSVRITSPLGRTGTAGTIRIVAQVTSVPGGPFPTVRFYVDGALLQTDDDGPPYAAQWVDDNPFAKREIIVEATDSAGAIGRDSIVLKPFEVVDATQVTSVLLETAVYNKAGRYVTGLDRSAFSVRENGVPQTLEIVRQEAIPATFALLIDGSQSMSRRISFVRTAAEHLALYLRPKDRVLVAPFSYTLGAITGPTADKATMSEAIAAIRPSGGTAILDSLVQIVQHLRGAEGRRSLILITDGYDENSTNSVDEALAALHSAQVTVYAVGIGGVAGISLRGERMLRRIALETGGRAFFPPREQDVAQVYDVLAADAQNRYLLSYTPSNQNLDGAWRAIEVMTTLGDLVVQTRRGYFAPKPPPIRPALEFTVTDAQQRYVDVTADNLVVLEDGVEQKIDTFQEAVSPVSVILSLDSSGSMKKSSDAVVAAARNFVQALRPEDTLAVMMFADKSIFLHDLSTERDHSFEAVDQYQAIGGTALYDALSDSLIRLRRVEGRRAVVVVTDGRDENNPGTGPGSVRTFDDVLARLKENGAIVFGVGIGSRVDRFPLEELARLSGGQAYFPSDVTSLPAEYTRIVENLRRRFILSYISTNTAHDGSWRKVEIRVRGFNLLVASRGGYFAPER